MKNLLIKIASIATELDYTGFTKEAKQMDLILLKLANENSNEKEFKKHYKSLFDTIFKLLINKVELLETERYKFGNDPIHFQENLKKGKRIFDYNDPDGNFTMPILNAIQSRFRDLLDYVASTVFLPQGQYGELGNKLQYFEEACNYLIKFCIEVIKDLKETLRNPVFLSSDRKVEFEQTIPVAEYVIYYANKMIELGRDLIENKPTQIDPFADSEKYLSDKSFYDERQLSPWFKNYNPGFDMRTGPRQIKEPRYQQYFDPLIEDQEEEN